MIYLLYGKDTFRSRRNFNELLEYFRSKVSNLGFFYFDSENFEREKYDELIKSRTLFENKFVVACTRIMERKEDRKYILENMEKCKDSLNIFLFWEEDLDEELIEVFKKNSQKIQRFELLSGARLKKFIQEELAKKKVKTSFTDAVISKCSSDLWCVSKEIANLALGGEVEEKKERSANIFAICDAIAEKNKRKAWETYNLLIMAGVPAEEIFWKIVWEVKNLILMKRLSLSGSKDPIGESGLKEFPARKAISYAKNFGLRELNDLSWKLIKFYHEQRIGIVDSEIEMERILIS